MLTDLLLALVTLTALVGASVGLVIANYADRQRSLREAALACLAGCSLVFFTLPWSPGLPVLSGLALGLGLIVCARRLQVVDGPVRQQRLQRQIFLVSSFLLLLLAKAGARGFGG